MRRSRWKVLSGGAALLGAAALAAGIAPMAGTAGAAGTKDAKSHKDAKAAKAVSSSGGYTIGFSNPQGTQPVLDAFQSALTAAAAHEHVKVTSLNANLQVSNQVSDIQQFINDKVKVIVVFPLAGPPLIPILTTARKDGIIVLGYNALTTNATTSTAAYPYNADLDQGLAKKGAPLVANFVLQKLHAKGNVLGVDIGSPVPSLHAFIGQAEVDVTHGHSKVHWLETVADQTDDISGAAGPVADALTKYHNKVNAVIAYFDGAAIGAAQSLKSAGVSATVTGQQGNSDGVAAVKSGEIAATLNVMPAEEALLAMGMVNRLVAKQSVPTIVYGPVQLVDKANLHSYVSWSSQLRAVQKGTAKPPTTITANPSNG